MDSKKPGMCETSYFHSFHLGMVVCDMHFVPLRIDVASGNWIRIKANENLVKDRITIHLNTLRVICLKAN